MKTQTRFFFSFFSRFSGNCLTLHLKPGNQPFKRKQCPLLLGTLGQETGQEVWSRNYLLGIYQGKENTTVQWDYFPGSKHLEWERRNCNGKFWARKMPLGKWVRINGKKWEFFIHWGNEESKNDRLEICLLTSEELQCASQLWRNCKFAYTDLPSVSVTKYLTPATCKERSVT